ncbi:MAG: hypothetical protein PHV46_07140 [Bacteroidales bacterium]|nr:hypothetical protein [Bacteroidales bacterium]MDD4057266.1 hypothetical protein [Bacteroidales bacterium]
MDEQDINIKSLISPINDETVPFGFENKVLEKIKREVALRESRKETIQNLLIVVLAAALFSGALLLINYYYFNISISFSFNVLDITESIKGVTELFKSKESLIWIGIGANIAILLLCERIISERLNKKVTD